MTVYLHTYFAAWPRLCDFWPGLNSAACGFQAKLASAEWPWRTRKKVHQITIKIYQPIRQYESYIIVHHCLVSIVYSIAFLRQTLFSQSELFSPRESRQPRESSEHRLRWMHLSLPAASLVALPSIGGDWHEKVSRLGSWHLERSTGVAWMWVAQESGAKIRKILTSCDCWS